MKLTLEFENMAKYIQFSLLRIEQTICEQLNRDCWTTVIERELLLFYDTTSEKYHYSCDSIRDTVLLKRELPFSFKVTHPGSRSRSFQNDVIDCLWA